MRLPLLTCTLALTLTACGAVEDTGGAGAQPVTAVAAVYPLAWLGEQIAPDARTTSLVSGALEAHDVELTPQQRGALESADVVLYLGDLDYQPQVETAVGSAAGVVVSATEVAGPDRLLAAAEHDHGEEETASDTVDPHLWFDPEILSALATATGEAFAEADPAGAQGYRSRAAAVVVTLSAVAADLETVLGQGCTFDEAIVSHAAYGYLLGPFGHGQHAVSGVDAEEDASAGELAEIVGEIRAEGFAHVLTEPVEGRDGAETVAREAGVELLEIFPLDTATDDQRARGLPTLLREQAAAFGTALGCGR